jgi:signal transduction histidine kinase
VTRARLLSHRALQWRLRDRVAVICGLLAPLAVSAVLVPLRVDIGPASVVLVLLAVVVAVSASGNRAATVLAAISAAAWFDFFFTRPYYRFDVAHRADLETTLLLLLLGVAVTELAVRERSRNRAARVEGALRRVATLVARAAPPQAVFDAVCEETGRLIGATTVNLAHFTPDGFNLTISGWSLRGVHVPTGTRLPLEGQTINSLVQRTGAPGRFDSYDGTPGPLAARLRELGIASEVGAPVVVNGQVWGALIAGTDRPKPLPLRTELRLASFADLIATAISNATAQAELLASRARIVNAGDAARRRLARDLHDGAQQRLVSAVMNLQMADLRFDQDQGATRRLLREALGHARDGLTDLRELAAGMHPSILTNRGLHAAVDALARRSTCLVEVEVPDARYPPQIEAAVYFVIAEALTNVAKHAQASRAAVRVAPHDGGLAIDIEDDGTGGADIRGGGLLGLKDRVEAIGGGLKLDSPSGHGTRLRATLPLSNPD